MNPAGNKLQLRDIHLPDSISWWPPAPGWWLILLIIVAVIVLAAFLYRYRQNQLLHRAAKLELEKIKTAYEQSLDTQLLVKSLSIWLRRVCLSFYPRINVAGLTGKAWLEFLDQQLITKKSSYRFSEGAGSVLINAPYQANSDVHVEDLINLCHHWLQCLPRRRSARV